jgi:hypothetical protein
MLIVLIFKLYSKLYSSYMMANNRELLDNHQVVKRKAIYHGLGFGNLDLDLGYDEPPSGCQCDVTNRRRCPPGPPGRAGSTGADGVPGSPFFS